MEEKRGIKESKELLRGCVVLFKLCVNRMKDGFQLDDLPVLLSKMGYDPELREAMKGVSKIPSEVKDLDLAEIMELASVLLKGVPEVFEELKK